LGNSHDGHATFTSMQKSKKFGDAFDIAYKGSVSDATKRALRKFGNALGNCLYSEKYRSEYKMHLARKGAKKKAAVAAKLRELAQKRLEKQQLNTTTTRFSNSCSSNSRKRPIELTTPKDMSKLSVLLMLRRKQRRRRTRANRFLLLMMLLKSKVSSCLRTMIMTMVFVGLK